MKKSYKELSKLKTIEDRYNYLKLDGIVGRPTFGFNRYVNQFFYQSEEWKKARRDVIVRDNGCDLGIEGFEIFKKIEVHHMNPITLDNILNRDSICYDLDNLICCSPRTHKAIHYSDSSFLLKLSCDRKQGDTCPWK